jgi:hypothetical protein
VKPVTNISFATIKKFLWQDIIYHFGVLREIKVDNAKQFNNDVFKDFYHQVGMKVVFVSVYHLQSNGTVERANDLIFEAIKKILKGKKKGNWAEVMPKAIWSHNTSVCRATNFSPFRLLFRSEAMTLEDIKHKSPRTMSEAISCTTEAEDKDLTKSDRLNVVINMQKWEILFFLQSPAQRAPESWSQSGLGST